MPTRTAAFDADFLAVKDALASGKLGKLVRLESHYDYFKTNGWYDHLGYPCITWAFTPPTRSSACWECRTTPTSMSAASITPA